MKKTKRFKAKKLTCFVTGELGAFLQLPDQIVLESVSWSSFVFCLLFALFSHSWSGTHSIPMRFRAVQLRRKKVCNC